MASFMELYETIEKLKEQGVIGDELVDELLRLDKDTAPVKQWGLHDMFNVSDEEEKSWYDESSRQFRSFEEVLRYFEETKSLNATVGYVRKALRRFRKDAKLFFLHWLSMLEDLCKDTSLGNGCELGDETLDTFITICYFAAETHDTDFFEPIMDIMYHLHTTDEEEEYIPICDFVYQHLHSILYNICPGDFDLINKYLLDSYSDPELNKELALMMAQLCRDGVFTREKQQVMLDDYVQFIFDYDFDGDAAAQWIVQTGKKDLMRDKLVKLLTYYIDPSYYTTCDPDEFYEMVNEDPERLCQKGIVMDDMILYGMYPKAIHAPEQIRRKAVREQEQRIKEFMTIFSEKGERHE